MPIRMLREFLRLETAAGSLLILATLLALAAKNSSLHIYYDMLLDTPVAVQVGAFLIKKPLLFWVNDGLMAIFFLLVGLEIKREVLEGQLSNRDQIALPIIAALGGLIVPALIYCYFNWHDPIALTGWAIPTATDIAFALGMLALLGNTIPEELKICLVAIAILDDLAAIIIIALFYTQHLSFNSLLFAMICIMIMLWLKWKRIISLTPYMLCGLMLWVSVLKSGIHATLAGVILALFIPMGPKDADDSLSPLKQLENDLHPWVAFGILPIFAFANAGVSLRGFSTQLLLDSITCGIFFGLWIGKPIGVLVFTSIGRILGWCQLPKNVSWIQFIGLAIFTGIGFTMSIFIGSLAFDDILRLASVRIAVLSASLFSSILGFILLKTFSKKSLT